MFPFVENKWDFYVRNPIIALFCDYILRWCQILYCMRNHNAWKCYCFIPIIKGIHFRPKDRWIFLIVSTFAAIYPLPYERLSKKQVPNSLTSVVRAQAVMRAKKLKHSNRAACIPTNLRVRVFCCFFSFVPGDPWDVRLRWAKSRGVSFRSPQLAKNNHLSSSESQGREASTAILWSNSEKWSAATCPGRERGELWRTV